MNELWNWQPNVGLEPFKFNTLIDEYIAQFELFLDPDDSPDTTDWIQYKMPNHEVSIDVENKKIVSIFTDESFCYQGNTLLGKKVSELESIIAQKPDNVGEPVDYGDGNIQIPLEYDSLGLIAWICNDVVISASFYEFEDD